MKVTKNSHPNVYRILGGHIKSQLSTQHQELIDEKTIGSFVTIVVGKGNRALYDLLDKENLVVSVWSEEDKWKYRIQDTVPIESIANSRLEAEDKAFQIALDRLEKR